MEFAKNKIKVLEKRIRKGEKLEEKDYAGGHLDQFLETYNEENEIDRELALILKGKSKKVRSKLNILKYMWKDKAIIAIGTGTAAFDVGVAYGGSKYFTGSGMPPDDAIPWIVVTIIATVAGNYAKFFSIYLYCRGKTEKGYEKNSFLEKILKY